ncbi:hypothetical protein F511_10382 [Dorcoceras hygrometricum]|uniref:Uncharacterized protein n=1 Tax=Dorcoceras hygrometricum TaxID=472368 RepID=A0A2Z7CC42_9LAMI|nr:hypothetical protein F511_10382 [Dorcoceras hygrometricum]
MESCWLRAGHATAARCMHACRASRSERWALLCATGGTFLQVLVHEVSTVRFSVSTNSRLSSSSDIFSCFRLFNRFVLFISLPYTSCSDSSSLLLSDFTFVLHQTLQTSSVHYLYFLNQISPVVQIFLLLIASPDQISYEILTSDFYRISSRYILQISSS